MVIGTFYGLLIFVVVFNIFLFITLRSKLYLYYALYVSTLALFLCNVDGISFKYFGPGSPWFANHSTIFFISLANLFLLLFSKDFGKYLEKASKTAQSVLYETEVKNQRGRHIWIQTNLTPITDNDNNVARFIAVDSEITKIKKTAIFRGKKPII